MGRLERALRDAGFRTLNLDYSARNHDIETLALQVRAASAKFVESLDGDIHFATHSMGGLVARSLIAQRRPEKLGRVVMLGPPNQGSEIADLLVDTWFYRRAFGPAGRQLTTWHARLPRVLAAPVDFPVGIIAGTRSLDPFCWAILPKPNDGKVSVARTCLPGMADHLCVPASHALMMFNPIVIRATVGFLREGRFPR